jgi:hypothetical protein
MTDDAGLSPIGDVDANEADVQEQVATASEPVVDTPVTESAEVDEFDAAEQGRPVELDEDEYR